MAYRTSVAAPASSATAGVEDSAKPAPWSAVDLLVLAVILLTTLAATVKQVLWHNLPAEDALMLMRYANHLAAGHGIVWNIGDPPVEGATDFFYLVVLSAWIKLSHLGAIFAARTLLAASHLAGTALLYVAARRIAHAGRMIAALVALYLGLGSGIAHASNGFSAPFYALAALAAWSFALSIVLDRTPGAPSAGRSLGFALCALLTGLIRPDGVLLAIFLTAAILFALGARARSTILITVAVFAVLGGAYFAWRFHYFGHLLPNPFYKKGGGHLYPQSFKVSLGFIFRMLLPFVPVFVVGLLVERTRKLAITTLIPIVLFGAVWVLLSNENNAGMRFQYVALPIGLLSAALLATELQGGLPLARWRVPTWAGAAFVVAMLPVFSIWWKTLLPTPEEVGTGPYHIAMGLKQFADRHYTIVATESGVIPYFSEWRSIDGWGLNDAEIVHNPRGITPEYLDRNHPAIIMLYASVSHGRDLFSRVWRGDAPPAEDINHLLEEESHYAFTHGYALAARWGITPCGVNIWYVRKDLPEFNQMMTIIRHEPDFYPYNEAYMAQNFLEADPPAVCEDQKSVVTAHD